MRDTIDMALEAGMDVDANTSSWGAIITAEPAELERFAALVRADAIANAVADEREACAKVLDEMADEMVADMEPSTIIAWVRNRADAIRTRVTSD
jgi:hypothetical protein